MDERVLFLSRLEFSVLLMAGGVEELICFSLPDSQSTDERQMIEAIYELTCMGCLQADETSVTLTESAKKSIDTIREADTYLMVESGNRSLPQKICYAGDRITVLENVQEEGKAFRLFSMDKGEFFQWLEDSMDIPRAAIEGKAEAEQILELSELAQKERDLLVKMDCIGKFQKISDWMEQIETVLQETVYAGIRRIDRQRQERQIDMLICQGAVNTWFLYRKSNNDIFQTAPEKEETYVAPDSIMLRKEIENMLWRKDQ